TTTPPMKLKPIELNGRVRLRDRDAQPPRGVPADEELKARTDRLVERLDELQSALFAEHERALLVVFQARDAGGKDGVIRKVFGPLNSSGVSVASFNAPTEDELDHDYLWRIHAAAPRRGTIGIFNRSHYEDVLVVRVNELVPPKVWKKRFEQINQFERMLAESGTTIVKFFLHVSREEQKQRFLERLDDPTKNWKFNPGDLEARNRWDEYDQAYAEAISRCSTPWAPWYVVPADSKKVRDYLVARVVVDTLRRMKPRFPAPDPELLAWRDKIV
ncbi:MAG TPA: PPK2 family polyphosphate kinase, partial [Longimicrobiaceae bacterium]|nr:PPK2 family polyphosphate kinase [Longimicrobiaceae bacterium]